MMTDMHGYDCIIIGAGISGLSTAYALAQRNASLLVVEAQGHVGGALYSETTPDGFVLEHGTQTVSSNDPEVWQHFAQLGIDSACTTTDYQRTYILLGGVLQPVPLSPLDFVRSPLLSPAAKLRMLAEPFLPRAVTADESVATFFHRRLGSEVARHIVDPFVTGVYSGDPGELSIRSLFPSLWELEQRHGSLAWGMLARAMRTNVGKAGRGRRKTFNFVQGLATWPRAIANALGEERVWLQTQAVALKPAPHGWQVVVTRHGQPETLNAATVVLAVPATVAAGLVSDLDETAARALQNVSYPPLAVVHLAYPRSAVAHRMDGIGMLCPTYEQSMTIGTLWMSTIFPSHAPSGMVLTTAFVGGAAHPYIAAESDETLVAMVKAEQQQLIGARGEPALARVLRWSCSIPQYDANHSWREGAYNRLEARWPRLYLLSNYRHGFSVEDCWKKGRHLGEHMVLHHSESH
jgi:protoporphyrinogen/coproporphyrinogen III oxidase